MGEARLSYPWIPQGVGCVVSHPRDDRGAPGRISGFGLVVQVGGVFGAKPTLGDTVPGAGNDHRGVRSVIGVVDRNRRSALNSSGSYTWRNVGARDFRWSLFSAS